MLKCLNGFYCRSRQFPSNCLNLATKTAAIRNTKHSQGKSNLPTSIEHKPINSKRLYFERRISESSKSEQALFNVILELRDKDRIDFLDLALQSALMLSRFKVEANPYILKSLNIILTWIKTHQVVINKEIIHQLTKNVFSNIRSKTILSDIINTLQMHNYAQDEDLQIPKLLYVLQQEVWSQPDVEYMKSYLDFILDNLVQYTSEDLNDILRVLGKVGLRSYSTKFFRKMTDTSISNSYTLDFYLSSFIIRVLDEHVGATMKDLQKFRLKNPEVRLFAFQLQSLSVFHNDINLVLDFITWQIECGKKQFSKHVVE